MSELLTTSSPLRGGLIKRPDITVYGDSFVTRAGQSLDQAKPKGTIDSSSLGTVLLGDDNIEWDEFRQTIRDFILINLGAPVVRVELAPVQLKSLVDQAITKLHYHCPMFHTQMAVFQTQANINMYEIPSWIMDNLEYVNYRKSLLAIQAQAGTLEFDYFIKYFQDNFLFSNFSVGQFNLLQIHLEQLRKILGNEGTFDVINNKYIQVQPTPIANDYVILVYRAIDTNTIHPAYRNWIQKYALALAKILLGNIRGKFKTLPGPGGGANLNGQELASEGKEEKQSLEEELIWEIEEPPQFSTF